MKGGGAPFYSALCAALCAMRSRKRPCQSKTAKRIFGGPGSQGPPGRQKSERVFCLFGGFFLRPARRTMCRAGRSCAADRCCGGFCDRCSGVFSAGVSLPCSQPAGWPPFFVWPALPPPGGCVRDFPLVRPRSASLFPARVPCRLPLLCGFLRPLPCLPAVRFLAHIFALFWLPCLPVLCCVRGFFSYLSPFPA